MILKGNIVYSKSLGTLEVCENGYLIENKGIVSGVYQELPTEYVGSEIRDYGDRLIIPGLVDLHVHAPQYAFRGLGMDLELLEWLERNTFPEEAKMQDLTYAKRSYGIFVEQLRKSATTRACIFATIHKPATMLLMELLEKSGLVTMVGKVNMDRNAPAYLCEQSAEASACETVEWIREALSGKFKNTLPILTPRFIPSCTDALLEQLGTIRKRYQLPVQSHLSENPGEIEWVRQLCPWAKCYADAYEQFGLFGADCNTVMAHCIYSEEEEITRIRENGVYVAHCPESNSNLSSGIAPIRRYLDEGIHVGLGSDIAAGSTENLFTAMAYAIQVSKLYWRLKDSTKKPLSVREAFYLATRGGGEFFGKVGSFERGYEMDAVILDDTRLTHPQELSVEKRLERMIYCADDREICGKYVKGNLLFESLGAAKE